CAPARGASIDMISSAAAARLNGRAIVVRAIMTRAGGDGETIAGDDEPAPQPCPPVPRYSVANPRSAVATSAPTDSSRCANENTVPTAQPTSPPATASTA